MAHFLCERRCTYPGRAHSKPFPQQFWLQNAPEMLNKWPPGGVPGGEPRALQEVSTGVEECRPAHPSKKKHIFQPAGCSNSSVGGN
eukprot:gene9547-biopygen19739